MANGGGMAKTFRLALIQLSTCSDKSTNLLRAGEMVREATRNGARLVALPECFNSPYGTSYFPEYSEPIPGGPSTDCLSQLAKDTKTWLVGGSIPEKDGDRIYNTCTVYDPNGLLIAKYRKIHLFDVDIPNKITFKESDVLSGGDQLVTFDTDWCKVGLGICYDVRFFELAELYRKKDVKLLIYPGAFNMTSGPLHWELLARARAVDSQMYTAACSVARDETASYTAWGHSLVVSPWGKVLASTDEKESIVYSDIDLTAVDEIRQQIPTSLQKRSDIYKMMEL